MKFLNYLINKEDKFKTINEKVDLLFFILQKKYGDKVEEWPLNKVKKLGNLTIEELKKEKKKL
jgi:hypothetical protein